MSDIDLSSGAPPLVAHLVELRNRLLYCVLIITVIFLALFSFANEIYTFVATPLQVFLPENCSMIATEVAAPFLTPFKLTFFVAFVLAIPFVFYQVWAFLAPGLYENEKNLVMPLILSSVLLFYTGIAFAYTVVFPLVFGFFTSMAPEGVTVRTEFSSYLDFVLKLFLAFGIVFEIPIATILLLRSGVVSAETLTSKRPYIVVACFVIGMLLTPPDVISQILLAVPMWMLFECGVFFGKRLQKSKVIDE
jgi:sec-independent protein translocase protein TatC